MAAAGAAIAAPLLLHFLAFDTAREWTYPVLVAFTSIRLASLTEAGPASWGPWSRPITIVLAVAAIGINLSMHYPLLDGEVDRFSYAVRLLIYAPFLAGTLLVIARGRRTT